MTEPEKPRPSPLRDDEIDLRELLHVLWSGTWLIGGITFAVTVIAVVAALMLPDIYRAEALLDQLNATVATAAVASFN